MNKPRVWVTAILLSLAVHVSAQDDTNDKLLAEMVEHVRHWENRVLAEGRPLTGRETRLAREAGVKNPEKVRVILRDSMPVPQSDSLKAWLSGLGMLDILQAASGAARGYGIIVRRDYEGSDLVMVHELVHVAQYERLGGLEAMLATYLNQLQGNEYRGVGLEEEAFSQTREILWRFTE